jgi:hypothetical protein
MNSVIVTIVEDQIHPNMRLLYLMLNSLADSIIFYERKISDLDERGWVQFMRSS